MCDERRVEWYMFCKFLWPKVHDDDEHDEDDDECLGFVSRSRFNLA